MPLHKRISRRDLEEWICYIKLVCSKILLNPDIIFVSHLIVSLFEYCQVYCYFKINGVKDEAVNFKVTVDNIKAILNGEEFYAVANNFMRVRHSLSHGFISDITEESINLLLKNPKFMLLLREIDLDLDAVNCIEEATSVFCRYYEADEYSMDMVTGLKSNYTTSTLESVLKEAKGILNVSAYERERRFKEVLKSYGVTKCYINEEFDFGSAYAEGEIYVDVKDNMLFFGYLQNFY